MPRISKGNFRVFTAASCGAGLLIAAYPILGPMLGMPVQYPPDLYLLLGLVAAMFPPGVMHLMNVMWRRAVDRNIPRLLRYISEAGRVGVSIPKALELASTQDLGPLTPLLRKLVARLSWGYPMDKAIQDMIEEIGTPTARRAFLLILEAARYGGDIEQMFSVLQSHLTGIQLTMAERRAIMRPYIAYGYIAFFVFLAIQVILLISFFAPIFEMQERAQQVVGGQLPIGLAIDSETIRRYFYHISIAEAVISGLVAGKMGEGTMFAGLKHVAVLLIATILVYHFLVKV